MRGQACVAESSLIRLDPEFLVLEGISGQGNALHGTGRVQFRPVDIDAREPRAGRGSAARNEGRRRFRADAAETGMPWPMRRPAGEPAR